MLVAVVRWLLFVGVRKVRFGCTIKLVYNDHPWDPKFVAIVDRLLLFRGSFMLLKTGCLLVVLDLKCILKYGLIKKLQLNLFLGL